MLLEFAGRIQRDQYRFLAAIGGAVVLAIVAALSASPVMITLVLVVTGAVLFTYPFATPQTAQLLGVRRAVRLVRLSAVALLVWGVYRLFV